MYNMSSISISYNSRLVAARFTYTVVAYESSRNCPSDGTYWYSFLLCDILRCNSKLNRPIYNPSLVWSQLRPARPVARYRAQWSARHDDMVVERRGV